MPIEYKLKHNGTVVLARATGTLTLDDFLTMQKQLNADPFLQTPHKTLLDVRNVATIQIEEDDLKKIAQSLTAGQKRLGAEQLAIVATTAQAFRLGKKYGETPKDVKEIVVVFSNLDVAQIWLGINRDE